MSPLERSMRDLLIHGGAWLFFGWRVALTTFVAHFLRNLWSAHSRGEL